MVNVKDWFGKFIKRDNLASEQTSEVGILQRQFATHPSRGLTPAVLADIMQQAEYGYCIAQHDLFVDMEEKDAHIFAEMGKRKRAVVEVEWDIVPPRGASATEKKLAGYAKELIQDIPNLEGVLLDSLDAIGHGFACQEIEWQMIGQEWFPGAIEHRPQSWFQTDRATRSEIRLRDMSTPDGQELWPFGWITHVHKAKSGYLSRAGLHRVLAWPYLFKNYSVGDLAELLEIYGLPIRTGKYPSGASDTEKSTLLQALMSIGHNAAGIIPDSMVLEFNDAATGSHLPFEAMTTWAEKSQSKAILGGTLTSQADGKTSTNALGKTHETSMETIVVSDCKQLSRTLTRDLVYPILALNKGGINDLRRCPRMVFNMQETEDMGVFSSALPKLVGLGMRIKEEWAMERLGIPQAEEGDRILTIPQPVKVLPDSEQPVADAADTATAAATASVSPDKVIQDDMDALVSEALSDWHADLAPAAATIQALMDESAAKGETAEQFLAQLPALLKASGPLALDGKLTQAAFTARLGAEAGIEPKDGR